MKHVLSKTTFLYGLQCSKRLWLHKNKPRERDVSSPQQERIFQQGTDVGILARQLFAGGIDASPPNAFSYHISVQNTQRYILAGHQIIYEAAFMHQGVLCAVDILVKTKNGWIAYEVKSTTKLKSPHIRDAALQHHVILQSGLQLHDFVLIHLNRNYIRQGELNLRDLFYPVSVLEQIQPLGNRVQQAISKSLSVLALPAEPLVTCGAHCINPYPCDFTRYCNFVADTVTDSDSSDLHKTILPGNFLLVKLHCWSSAIPLRNGHWPYRRLVFGMSIYSSLTGCVDSHFFLQDDGGEENAISILQTQMSGKIIIACADDLGILNRADVHHKQLVSFEVLKLIIDESVMNNLYNKELQFFNTVICKKQKVNTEIKDVELAAADYLKAVRLAMHQL